MIRKLGPALPIKVRRKAGAWGEVAKAAKLVGHARVAEVAERMIQCLLTQSPMSRDSEIYAREKVDLHRSTLTDWVGRSTALLETLADHIGKQVRAGPTLFADDTPGKMQIGG